MGISIVIPVYNVEAYIADCLQSVMRQTYTGPLECVLVDDCGTDRSMFIAEEMIAEYNGPIDFRVVHHERNRGLSAARNTGVDVSTGDYIYFLDSDDFMANKCIDVLTKPLQENDFDVVLGDLEMVGKPLDVVFLAKESGPVFGQEAIFQEFYVKRTLYVMAWNKLVKSSLFRNNDLRFLEGQCNEDELWTYKLASSANSLYVSDEVTYYYRIREGGIMRDVNPDWAKRVESRWNTLDYILLHPAHVQEKDWRVCMIYSFDWFIATAYRGHVGFRVLYIKLRQHLDYHPWAKYRKGEMSFQELKHEIHLALPPRLGYFYLKIRGVKKKLIG